MSDEEKSLAAIIMKAEDGETARLNAMSREEYADYMVFQERQRFNDLLGRLYDLLDELKSEIGYD